ncbi:DNA-binding transcriptional regulator, GntR family [Variovorax sp. 770b2]|nr:DNA-binding transcriptional regulator, GntR family [Variovorax sp. 770b2]
MQKSVPRRSSGTRPVAAPHVDEAESPLADVEENADQSLSERAHRALMGMILSGELAPTEVITERQIAIQLGVSRTPLREAIRRLEGARLLERQRSGVLVVRALPIEEYISILDVRRLLESEAARLAAGQIPLEELERLRGRANAVLALPEDAVIPAAAEDEDLHLMIAASAGNPVLEEMILAMRTRTSMFRFGRFPARRRDVMREHLAIVDALASGNGALAQQAMEQHLDQVRATIIARLTDSRRRG